MSANLNKNKESVHSAKPRKSIQRNDALEVSDSSLGILNIDEMSDSLGDKSAEIFKIPEINERLKNERKKALNALNRAVQCSETRLKTPINKLTPNAESPRTPSFNQSGYVSYKQYDSINITDLMSDKTIEIKSVDSPITSSTRLTFEPSEITARSTMCADLSEVPTIDQILASSFSQNVRNLRESLRESYGGSSSLPRTADMSLSSSRESLFKSKKNEFSFSNCRRANFSFQNEAEFSDENFIPAENMHSKFVADEMAWKQEYAAIPTATMSDSSNTEFSPTAFNYTRYSNSLNNANNDISMGGFFSKRSENLQEMKLQKSPTKREAYALVDSSVNSAKSSFSNFTIPERDIDDSNAIISNETYEEYKKALLKRDSITASGLNSEVSSSKNGDNSYVLSVSAIATALNSMESPDSGQGVLAKLLKTKQVKSYLDKANEPLADITERINRTLSFNSPEEPKYDFPKPIVFEKSPPTKITDKENVIPKIDLSDTASFTDSILNCSELKHMQESDVLEVKQKSHEKSTHILPRLEITSPIIISDDELDTNNKVPQKKSRKRSHSSTRVHDIEKLQTEKTISRRSKSPSNINEMAAVSSSVKPTKRTAAFMSPDSSSSPTTEPMRLNSKLQQTPTNSKDSSERKYLLDVKSPGDSGKYSLPSYGLINVQSSSPIHNACALKTRCASECSNSSEFSHKDGKLPLKATCQEVSWGSTKLRTNTNKSIQIKNTSNKRLVLRIEISGPGFQINNLVEQGNRLTMQPQECRTIVLSFCPTVIGPAVGKLSFYPPFEDASPASIISLYGYGGHASIRPQNVTKGPIGAPFLTMGELRQLSKPLEKTFTLYNKGPLTAFACIIIDSLDVDHPRFCDSIEITPNKVLVPPEGYREIKVEFKPRREDLKRIVRKLAPVMTIAKLKIICGDEPTRQRIRNLIRQMNEIQMSDATPSSLKNLWNTFPDESQETELFLLREQSTVAMELVSTLKTHDILLTIDHFGADDSINSTILCSDIDETVLFRTMVSESSFAGNTNIGQDSRELFYVRPKCLEVNPFDRKNKSILFIRSNCPTEQYFEIETNHRQLLTFTPKEGHLYPGQEAEIIVDFKSTSFPKDPININIYLEKERLTVPVKIKKGGYAANIF